MKRFFLSILFLATVSYNFSQQINLAQGNAATKNYYSEISFKYVKDKIIIPVNIQGKTYKFLLDTGAPNIISKELYNTINTSLLGKIPVSDAHNKKSSSEVVSIPSLTFGVVTFENTPALVHDLNESEIFKCFKVDGFLGSNMLRNSIIQIDLNNKLIRLTDNKKSLQLDKKNSTKLKLIGNQKKPYIWINFKGKGTVKEQVLIDTGMSGFYDISSKKLPFLQKSNVFDTIAKASGTNSFGLLGAAEKKEQIRLFIPNISIANSDFKKLVTITTNDNNSRLGTDLLNYGSITVDFKNKRFYYNTFQQTANLEKKLSGFEPTIIDEKLVIGFVWDEDLKSTIKFGDQILRVNDVDFSNLNVCDFVTKKSIIKNAEGLEVLVKKENGEQILIKIHKKFPKP